MTSMNEPTNNAGRSNSESKKTDLTTESANRSERTDLAPSRNQTPATLPRGSSVLDHAFNSLPVEKQHELMETALQKKIEIETKAAEAQQAYRNFEHEIQGSVEHVRELGRTGMDVTGNYEGRTASGSWNFEVRKSNYTVIMVVAAIIGVVAIFLAMRH